jgi:hypothetical protein
MLDQLSLSETHTGRNFPRPPREIRGLFLAKNNLPAAARAKLAADIRDGRATVVKPTTVQCAALCRVPTASVRVRGPRKTAADALAKAWGRATAVGREAFLRTKLDALLTAAK